MIKINMPKAKTIGHEKRRYARGQEFLPLDIQATIPAEAQRAEIARQGVRNKYALMQAQIDAAVTLDEIKTALSMP